jgi:hypothetical protein
MNRPNSTNTTPGSGTEGSAPGPSVAGVAARATAPAEGWGGAGVVDRRSGVDRRAQSRAARGGGSGAGEPSAEGITGLERRRGPGRRLSDFTRAAEEGELTNEQFMFVMAIEAFKRTNQRTFPTWTDVLEVIRLLGYRKTLRSELHLRNAEDWTEKPDAPANVRPNGWEKRFAA